MTHGTASVSRFRPLNGPVDHTLGTDLGSGTVEAHGPSPQAPKSLGALGTAA